VGSQAPGLQFAHRFPIPGWYQHIDLHALIAALPDQPFRDHLLQVSSQEAHHEHLYWHHCRD
jgi:hypothetical protein